MLVELTEDEVKRVGENRWLRKHWKKWVSLIGSLLTLIIILGIVFGKIDYKYDYLILYPIAAILFGAYVYIFYIQAVKKGKEFLAEMKK